MSRLTESFEVIRNLREIPNARASLGIYMNQPISPEHVAYEWWQRTDRSSFFQTSDTITLELHRSKREFSKGYPVYGVAIKPIPVGDDMLTLRRLQAIPRNGPNLTELVGIDSDVEDIFGVVGTDRVYGYAEISKHPRLEIPGGQPITEEIARSFAIVLNQFAPQLGGNTVQLRPGA